MKKLFIGVYNPSIILTYLSVFCAICGIGILLVGNPYTTLPVSAVVLILLVAAGVCDMFDGKVARLCKRTEQEKAFGIQLDSLADTVSFVVFPIAILLFVTRFSIVGIIVSCFYGFAGIMRLGWFNITTEENGNCFYGLPVTTSAIIIPLTYLILRLVNMPIYRTVFCVVYAIVGLLFILNFKIKKPNVIVALLLALLAIGTIAGLILISI